MNQILLFPKNAGERKEEIIRADETRYAEGILNAARSIAAKNARFVFLAGPSCSGKSTTAEMLIRALQKMGKRVLAFSTDDFFFDGEHAPKNEDSSPNYDAFEHTDSDYICGVLRALSQEKDAVLPVFDFLTSKRTDQTKVIKYAEWDVFILEGIHALNDKILSAMPDEAVCYHLYLDVTAHLAAEGKEALALEPREIRFCRRLIRDFKHRGANAQRTFQLWKNVLRMEEIILHPYQKNADMILNTNFCYEIAVEKEEVLELLGQVKKDSSDYAAAERLAEKLLPFPQFSEDLVPEESVLREFID